MNMSHDFFIKCFRTFYVEKGLCQISFIIIIIIVNIIIIIIILPYHLKSDCIVAPLDLHVPGTPYRTS